MPSFVINVLVAAIVVAGATWLSQRNAVLAGFIIAMPILTMITLPLSHGQTQDSFNSVMYAKSIFAAVPLSLLFFVPFLLADKLKLNFWSCYLSGFALLALGYFIHRSVVKWMGA